MQDFPDGPGLRTHLPVQGMGSIPGLGRCHMPQSNYWSLQALEHVPCNEKPVHHN